MERTFGTKTCGGSRPSSIVEFKGQWYYFYHIGLKTLPLYKESQGRIVSFDKLFYNPDGTIKMVEFTKDPNAK